MYLIGWVAVQYHWILDESVQYLSGSSKTGPMSSDIGYWMATHSVRNLLCIIHTTHNGMFLKPSNNTGYWTVCSYEILRSGVQ